ncbi:hypothetical protein JTB14_013957 [Gonioctena quinquepunctata]|nr:hypothetical protein JTB14_013957 [Gonioctena quinquepunctata]
MDRKTKILFRALNEKDEITMRHLNIPKWESFEGLNKRDIEILVKSVGSDEEDPQEYEVVPISRPESENLMKHETQLMKRAVRVRENDLRTSNQMKDLVQTIEIQMQ